MTLASAAFAAARAMSHAARPASSGGGRVGEAQRLARGGQPRFPVCRWRPRAPLPPWVGIPVGAYVCAEAETVQRVRAALLDSGRLKPHGVTRFDARVWRALDEDGHLPIPTDPDAAEWAVHVFGLPPGRPEDDAVAALIDSGAVRYVPGVRIGSPACYVHLGDKRADRDRDLDPGRRQDDTSSPSSGSLGVFIPAATSAESAAESARRVDAEARARPGGRVQPPKWAPPDDHPTFARFTFSELFAGVGGFGAALRDLGGEATFASESCPHARRTYVVNHGCGAGTGAPGDGPLVVGDITDVCEEIIPPHDVLTGGFPCQSFSARGQRRGLDDPRGALYREILRTLVACRPRAFLLENVEGLATMDDGEVLDVIVADLRAAGYDVETKIIDAAGWVPQSRRRVFFVGFRVEDAEDDENVRRPWTTTADSRAARRSGSSAASRFRWPTRTRTRGGTVRDVLEDECGNDATAACEVSERQTRRAARFFRRRDEETNVTYLEADLDGVARTLVASYRKSSAYNAELVAPAGERRRRPRYYTAREAARLQGFPESFALDPDRGHHELGNSVAVPLVRDIAVEMLRALGVEETSREEPSERERAARQTFE